MPTDIDHRLTRELLGAQVLEFATLSTWYAERGESRYAALAVWAADVRALQSALLDGLVDPRGVSEALQSMRDSVAAALAACESAPEPSIRAVVESARQAVLAVLDEPTRACLEANLVPLDHLDHLAAPAPGAANEGVSHRLDGRAGEELVADLLTAASDCRAVARMMALVGDAAEAERQSTSADLASYEAYLILASAASGDATLAVTELRWSLAVRKALDAPTGPDGTPGQTSGIRGSILATAVPAERAALSSLLAPAQPVGGDGGDG